MDPTSVMSFPQPCNFLDPLFTPEVYRKADGVPGDKVSCKMRFDSADGLEQRKSIVSTNWIMFLLNEHVRKPLREIPSFPKIDEHPDAATVQKVEHIFQRFLSSCPQDLGTGTEREQRVDAWHRTNRIFQEYFRIEIPYLMKFLQKTRGMPVKEIGGFVCGKIPGSFADAIGVDFLRQVQASADAFPERLVKIAESALARGMTVEQFRGLTRQAFDGIHDPVHFPV